MKITVTITKTLEDYWGVEDIIDWTDKEIIEFLHEDLISLFENAEWKITKEKP